MAPTKDTKPKKKEKLFHPLSRKAGQLERKQLRTAKLRDADAKKTKKMSNEVDKHSFFFHALPPEVGSITLTQFHDIVQNIWLPRHDAEIEQEMASRRPGRPPSTKEVRLTQLKEREAEEYRTGLELIDLTHKSNVELLRRWRQDDAAFLQQLRYVRISRDSPSSLSISRPGKHANLLGGGNRSSSVPSENLNVANSL